MARAKKVPEVKVQQEEQTVEISMEEANAILDKLEADLEQIPNDTDSLKMKVLLTLLGGAELHRCTSDIVHARTLRLLEIADQVTQLIKGEV